MQFISLTLQTHYQLTKFRLQVQADLKICKMLSLFKTEFDFLMISEVEEIQAFVT